MLLRLITAAAYWCSNGYEGLPAVFSASINLISRGRIYTSKPGGRVFTQIITLTSHFERAVKNPIVEMSEEEECVTT